MNFRRGRVNDLRGMYRQKAILGWQYCGAWVTY
jgi:hypothetical protein